MLARHRSSNLRSLLANLLLADIALPNNEVLIAEILSGTEMGFSPVEIHP
jgi:hypothetical protein